MGLKKLFIGLCMAICLQSPLLALDWMDDLPAAEKAARDSDRAVFLFFTGSDWCGYCMALEREILNTPDFNAFAGQNLVLVKVDFPRRTSLPAAQAQKNQDLAQKYRVEGFPTIFLLSKDGRNLGQFGYSEGGPGPFIRSMTSVSGINWRTPSAGGKAAPAKPRIADSTPFQAFNGAKLLPPKQFTDIVLNGITGTKQRPMIMVNNQTLMPGESVRIKIKDKPVKVTCKEIKTKSAIVLVEGKQQEIFLESER